MRLWPRQRRLGHLNDCQCPHLSVSRNAGVAKEALAWPKRRWRGQRGAGVAKEALAWPKRRWRGQRGAGMAKEALAWPKRRWRGQRHRLRPQARHSRCVLPVPRFRLAAARPRPRRIIPAELVAVLVQPAIDRGAVVFRTAAEVNGQAPPMIARAGNRGEHWLADVQVALHRQAPVGIGHADRPAEVLDERVVQLPERDGRISAQAMARLRKRAERIAWDQAVRIALVVVLGAATG